MADKTRIEWADATWNPIRGCSRVSEGCRHCYAERQAARFAGPGQPYEGLVRSTDHGPRWTGEVRLVHELMDAPLRWRKPRRIFVNSMSDLFHPQVPFEFIDRIWLTMSLTPRHTYQILTKRPDRMFEVVHRLAPHHTRRDGTGWPLPNVWLGVSVEDQRAADERVPLLLQTPAAVRFVSCEPLLGPVDLTAVRPDAYTVLDVLNGCGVTTRPAAMGQSVPNVWTERLDWVVVGGESGPGARPMHPDWVRSIRDACVAAGVPFFFKQWGEWAPYIVTDGDPPPPLAHLPEEKLENWWTRRDVHVWESRMVAPPGLESYPVSKVSVRVGKKRAGAFIDGREWREWPDERRSG